MLRQVFGYEVAVYAEGSHLAEREHGASVSSGKAENFFHALHRSVEGSRG